MKHLDLYFYELVKGPCQQIIIQPEFYHKMYCLAEYNKNGRHARCPQMHPLIMQYKAMKGDDRAIPSLDETMGQFYYDARLFLLRLCNDPSISSKIRIYISGVVKIFNKIQTGTRPITDRDAEAMCTLYGLLPIE